MNSCSTFNDQIVDVVNGVADEKTAASVSVHAASCPSCAAYKDNLQSLTSTRTFNQDPGDAYWDAYYAKLEERMAIEVNGPLATSIPDSSMEPQALDSPRSEAKAVSTNPPSLLHRLNIFPMWSVQTAAAILLLLTGVWIGQSYFWTAGPGLAEAAQPSTELENQALSYLDRTKTLLLGLANFNPEEDDPALLNIDRRKDMAGGLIQEASLLKKELTAADQERLSELISDLEVILLQIANLESEFDIPEIEMVKNGVDRKAIFFKIDVENMLRSSNEPEPTNSTNQPQHSAI